MAMADGATGKAPFFTSEWPTRQVFATVPPTVEYALTAKGEKLLPSIKSLHQWGLEHAV
jgi:DNA-binding HxlR family transcriptional regulator